MVCVGDRVAVTSRHATVRYLGSVDGHPGEWAGLEWDDPDGGKHCGTVGGTRYFTTRFPKNGSLVKQATLCTGVDLLDAIRDRYDDTSEQNTQTMSTRVVELVGMTKIHNAQGNIYKLRRIILDGRFVSKPPPPGTEQFTRCEELNLYGNLLHRWEDVRDILSYFPILRELVLRHNRMDEMDDSFAGPDWIISPKLTDIILSDCALSASTIYEVLTRLCNIQLLYALRNDISVFAPSLDVASRLVTLDLEGNPLRCFTNLRGHYTSLTSLSLASCGIEKINLEGPTRFPSLASLNLKHNSVRDWSSISQLNYLPSLVNLGLQLEPLPVVEGINHHEVTISKVPTLELLNSFDVSPVERRSAEVRFVNKYANLPEAERLEHQTDIDRLIEIHGRPSTETDKKGLRILKIGISCGDRKVEKSLPLTATVQKIIEMLSRLFSLDPLATSLQLDKNGYIVPLDDPMREFSFYSPEASDTLSVISA